MAAKKTPGKKGRPKKRPPVRRFTLELPVDLVEDLDAEAEKRGWNRTQVIIRRLSRR